MLGRHSVFQRAPTSGHLTAYRAHIPQSGASVGSYRLIRLLRRKVMPLFVVAFEAERAAIQRLPEELPERIVVWVVA